MKHQDDQNLLQLFQLVPKFLPPLFYFLNLKIYSPDALLISPLLHPLMPYKVDFLRRKHSKNIHLYQLNSFSLTLLSSRSVKIEFKSEIVKPIPILASLLLLTDPFENAINVGTALILY